MSEDIKNDITLTKMTPEKRIKFLIKKVKTCVERRELLKDLTSDELYNKLLRKLNDKEFNSMLELNKICSELKIEEPKIETNIFKVLKRKEKKLLHDVLTQEIIEKIMKTDDLQLEEEYNPLVLSNEKIIQHIYECYVKEEEKKDIKYKKKKTLKEIKEQNENIISEIEFIKNEFKRFTSDVEKIYNKLVLETNEEIKKKLVTQFNMLFDIYKTKDNFDYINNVLLKTHKNKNPVIQKEISVMIDIHKSFFSIPAIII